MSNQDDTTPLKPRILMATTSFPIKSGLISGVFVMHLTEALAQHAHVEVVAPDGTTESASNKTSAYRLTRFRYAPRQWQQLAHQAGGIPVALKKNPVNWLLVPPLMASMLWALIRRGRHADLIHANWSTTGLIAGIAGKLLGKPVITTLRGSDVAKLESSILQRNTLRVVLALSAETVTVSKPMQIEIQRCFPHWGAHVHHIPNGVTERLLEVPPAASPGETLRLLYIGNLTTNKAIADVINAMATMADHQFSLTLVGEGPERDQLEALASKLGVQSQLKFEGSLPPEVIPELFARHDALILASHSEGRPNVVVEAMAAGRVVLASRLPGVSELIKDRHNGLLFSPGNIPEIIAQLQYLKSYGQEALAIGRAARKTIIDSGLSWGACAAQYHQLYGQVMAG